MADPAFCTPMQLQVRGGVRIGYSGAAFWVFLVVLTMAPLLVVFLSGCSGVTHRENLAAATPSPAQTLSPGDVLKFSFPGAPNLDTTQPIRRDGMINLAMVGEVKAADKTPAGLEMELSKLYAPQLVSKEVKVTVVSSSFAVFVTGAVLRPGKITPDHEITALEAIMEAGGFDFAKANARSVRIIRQEAGQTRNFTLNLKSALDGKRSEPFYLKSHDIIYVPEKFNWF